MNKGGLGIVGWITIIIIILLIAGGSIFVMNKPKDVFTDIEIDDVICTSDTYDCSEFERCMDVFKVFITCGSDDIHYLDGDGDGIPCESLCDEEDKLRIPGMLENPGQKIPGQD